MKIIKKTNEYRFECHNCGCIFVCEDREVEKEYHRNEEYYTHDCPTCGEKVSGDKIINKNQKERGKA